MPVAQSADSFAMRRIQQIYETFLLIEIGLFNFFGAQTMSKESRNFSSICSEDERPIKVSPHSSRWQERAGRIQLQQFHWNCFQSAMLKENLNKNLNKRA